MSYRQSVRFTLRSQNKTPNEVDEEKTPSGAMDIDDAPATSADDKMTVDATERVTSRLLPFEYRLSAPVNLVSAVAELSDNYTQNRLPLAGEQLASALPILYRYVTNVADAPAEAKYQTIRTTNQTFREKVAACPGAVTFLTAAGFVQTDSGYDSDSTAAIAPELRLRSVDLARLSHGKELLESLATHLGVSLHPAAAPKSTLNPTNRGPIEFDPFKPFITRNSPQVCRTSYYYKTNNNIAGRLSVCFPLLLCVCAA